MSILGHKVKPAPAEEHLRVETFFESLKKDCGDCFNALRSLPSSLTSDYAQLLQRIGRSCNFQIEFHPSESRSSLG